MKKYLLFILIAILTNAAMADDGVNGREGFFMGFGVGGGGVHYPSFNRGAFFSGLRIGGGITENLLLMGETHEATTWKNGSTWSTHVVAFSAQWFLTDGFYVRPGVGFAVSQTSSSTGTRNGSTIVVNQSDAGLGVLASSGYEFRLGRSFALSPEATFNYDHITGRNLNNYGGVLGMLWYW